MEGEARRQKIMETLELATEPITGTDFSGTLGVSRQVIVQDIALLRATNKNILSTNRGYVLFKTGSERGIFTKIIHVKHNDNLMREELYDIVDVGARIKDVIIEHEVYGQISVDLVINNRRDVDDFMDKINHGEAKPLNLLTGNNHYHTIEADNEMILENVEKILEQSGILIRD
ncbi:MAG: transcription repressor NadR [Lachnospiraceae bacterium]|jgi:transcriptional regulator of NAD metabolism|nr:transcription repressor NadR [Lachnospiraceae bacterium]